jgi:hypothetical protein
MQMKTGKISVEREYDIPKKDSTELTTKQHDVRNPGKAHNACV